MSKRPGGGSSKRPKRKPGKGPKRPETPRGETPPKRSRKRAGETQPAPRAERRSPRAELQARQAADAPIREAVVCELFRSGKKWVAEPFFDHRGGRFLLEEVVESRNGDLVLLRLPRKGRHEGPRIMRTIGRPDVAADVIEGLMLDRGLARRFPPGV